MDDDSGESAVEDEVADRVQTDGGDCITFLANAVGNKLRTGIEICSCLPLPRCLCNVQNCLLRRRMPSVSCVKSEKRNCLHYITGTIDN